MSQGWTARTATVLAGLYALDRLLKLAAVEHFFRRPAPPAPDPWPSLTLIQPVTRGATDLAHNLRSRITVGYSGTLDHVAVCDAADHASLATCRDVLGVARNARIVTVAGDTIAAKTTKLEAGLGEARGEIVCFIDDDIALRPGALDLLVRHLMEPEVGAVFGLAAYIWWRDVPSSLMSLFVNANALLSYVPLAYLTEPFTITGHCYAVRRSTLDRAGTFRDMDHFVDDDHDLAQRVRGLGLRNVQTAVVYDVSNALPTMRAYRAQMKRWFVLPRQAMMPHMSRREQTVSALGSVGNLVPGVLALFTLVTRRHTAVRALLATIVLAAGVQAVLEARYIGRRTPPRRWLLFPVAVVLTPFQIVAALLSDDTVEWRGRRMQVRRGGAFRTEEHP